MNELLQKVLDAVERLGQQGAADAAAVEAAIANSMEGVLGRHLAAAKAAGRELAGNILDSGGSRTEARSGSLKHATAAIVLAVAAAKASGATPLDIAKRNGWDQDPLVARAFSAEARQKALTVGELGSGGAFIPEEFHSEYIELLRPNVAVRKLNPLMPPMPGGNLTIPKVLTGTNVGYVGEARRIPASQPTTGVRKLTAKKLACFVPVSNELIGSAQAGTAGTNIERWLQDQMIADAATAEDFYFIRGTGTDYSPKGLRNWAASANIVGAQASPDFTKVMTDLGKVRRKLAAANVRMIRPGWVFNPVVQVYLEHLVDGNGNATFREEMTERKTLLGIPFASSTQIPINLGSGDKTEIILADFADVLLGEVEGLSVDTSAEASYYDGTEWQSAYQSDLTLVRLVARHDFGVKYEESVAVLNDCTWGTT